MRSFIGCCLLGVALSAGAADAPRRATRIISLDYCADQYVLALAEREHILALSPDATSNFSYLADRAQGVPWVRPRAEDVLLMKPDLVVRSYGGGAALSHFLDTLGIPVLQLGFSSTLDDLTGQLQTVADRLGQSARGKQLVDDFDTRLRELPQGAARPKALYMTPGGVTTGPGSLIHEMLLAAGLDNFSERPGWHALPLERLAGEQPDLIAAAFFDARDADRTAWSAMRHPIAQRQLQELPAVGLNGAWTSCGSWFLMDAVEALAEAHGSGPDE